MFGPQLAALNSNPTPASSSYRRHKRHSRAAGSCFGQVAPFNLMRRGRPGLVVKQRSGCGHTLGSGPFGQCQNRSVLTPARAWRLLRTLSSPADYHTRQIFSVERRIGALALHPNTSLKAGKLERGPLIRYEGSA